MSKERPNCLRRWLAGCQLACSLLLAIASIILYRNSRLISEPEQFLSLADTVGSYGTVLKTQRNVYLGFYEMIPPYRSTVQALHQLVNNCLPLAANLNMLSELPLFSQMMSPLKNVSANLNETMVGLQDSLEATDKALERYNPVIHQNVLDAIDNTIKELDKLSSLLRQQAQLVRQTTLILLAGGLLTSLVFALNAYFHLASLRQEG